MLMLLILSVVTILQLQHTTTSLVHAFITNTIQTSSTRYDVIIGRQILLVGKSNGVLYATTGSSSSSNNNKKKKISSKESKGGGGFGRTTVNTKSTSDSSSNKDRNDDYKVFPPLESRVRETLIPAPPDDIDDDNDAHDSTNTDELSTQVYQRLSQIYGFPYFNDRYQYRSTMLQNDFMDIDDDNNDASPASPLDYLMNNDIDDDIDDSKSNSNPMQQQQQSSSSSLSKVDPAEFDKIPSFPDIRILHIDPMVIVVDNFFTNEECDLYIQKSLPNNNNNNNNKDYNPLSVLQSRSPTVGKDSNAKAQRTSTTFYHMYEHVPELICKATRLLGLSTIHQWEEPQTVRYRTGEQFTWHLDALGPNEIKPIQQQQSSSSSPTSTTTGSGQRTATLLVYLNDMKESDGGATLFRDLGGSNETTDSQKQYLRIQPKKGMGLLFFPSAGGIDNCPLDIRTLHCGEVISSLSSSTNNEKWIAQLWLRQSHYTPTAPPGNSHDKAYTAMTTYCNQFDTPNAR